MLTFVRQLLKDRQHTGAVLPSSPRLAREMTRSVQRHNGSKRILEVGPGTGPFTRVLLRALRPGDELHIVEISPLFCQSLERKLIKPYRLRNPEITVRIHCAAIETAQLPEQFDFIVCGLPFNNFAPSIVRKIFRMMIARLAPGGELTYFEYAGVRAVKGSLSRRSTRSELRRIGATGRVLRRRYGGQRRLVLGNVPPAVAVRLVR